MALAIPATIPSTIGTGAVVVFTASAGANALWWGPLSHFLSLVVSCTRSSNRVPFTLPVLFVLVLRWGGDG